MYLCTAKDNVGSLNKSQNGPKIENNIDAPIEIADSDDEGDKDVSGMEEANDANGHNSNDEYINVDLDVDVKHELKVECVNEMMDLSFVEFDPNKESDRSNAENEAAITAAMGEQSQSIAQKRRLKHPSVKLFECKDCPYTSQQIHISQKSMGVVHDRGNGTFENSNSPGVIPAKKTEYGAPSIPSPFTGFFSGNKE